MRKMPLRLAASYSEYFLQLASLLSDPVYRGTQVPRGKGEPILLIPGFLAGDWTLGVLAGWLNRVGYRAYFSGVHWNIDCPNRTGDLLRWRLDHITQETGSSLVVIGHSLGGLLARFLGANFSEKIRHVVALGSPIDRNSLRVHPFVPLAFRTLQTLRRSAQDAFPHCGSPRCVCEFGQTAFAPLPEDVGSTCIFTKQDEVVDWRACLDPQGANREVSGRHMSLIVNRQVYRILANILANIAATSG
jgi:pimeloyl-ACP methyl ester carboxylesterase